MLIPGAYSFSDLLTLLALGLAANLLLGGPRTLYRRLGAPDPGQPFTRLVQWLEKRLNRSRRGETARRVRGLLLLVFMVALAAALAVAVYYLSLLPPYGSLLYILLIALLIRPRSLFDEAREIAASLDILGLEPSRPLLAPVARRDMETLDAYAACRAAIESLAENFSDRVTAPAFWFLLLGLPGLFAARAINAMDGIIGHRSSRFAAFGAATARADTVLNLIPARLSGLLLALAALFVPKGRALTALGIMQRDAPRFASANSGWPVAAMAGALRLTLGGPRAVEKTMVEDPWAGVGTVKATTADLRRASLLFAVAALLLVIACAAALYLL